MTLRERIKQLARNLDDSAVSEVPTQTMAADLFELLSDTEDEDVPNITSIILKPGTYTLTIEDDKP